jgi:hypothetical protein
MDGLPLLAAPLSSGNRMTTQPKHNILADRATDLLRDAEPLVNCYIAGEIKIETNETWDKEVVLENCVVEYFSGSVTHFEKPVRFINCQFKKCQFVSTYFFGGLTIDNCIFDDYLDFQAGGHNKTRKPVVITNNQFADFVNFFDCWYESEVIIESNNFQKGTNLLGKPFDIPVTFDVAPVIKNNQGQLDLNTE